MTELVQELVKTGSSVKLEAKLARLVRSGRLAPEALLPPVRELALAIQVSPGTVAAAYKALRAQGLVTADRRRGTRVLPRPAQREYGDAPAPLGTRDLQVANPDPLLLPDLRPIFAGLDARSDSYGGAHAEPALLERMRADFAESGIDGRHVVVVSGAISAIHRGLSACIGRGDKVAVEDPGFNEHHASVLAHGALLEPVALDAQGMLPESLAAALRAGARAVILAPRFQSPTGAALTKARAAALRAVLDQHPEVAVLADDYASLLCEARYHDCFGKGRARWLVVRSFNKPLAPDLRVGVAAADAETCDRIQREQWLTDGWVSIYLQRAAAAALASRKIAALLERARETYASRRTALLEALALRGIAAQGATGLNVWIPVPDEAAAARGMLERGVCVRAGARYRLRSPSAIRLTIAEVPPREAAGLADRLAEVLRASPRSHGP